MALTEAEVESHIATWRDRLERSNVPYRRLWPKRLFRHERVENAARILLSGSLLCRSDATGFIDVAAPEVVTRNERAHESARLYFRPGTPTQFSTEGIRRPSELRYGGTAHAPVLVMFVFNAASVLTVPGVRYTNGNAQADRTKVGSDKAFFSTIPFDAVYHTGPFAPEDRERIIHARCAEVLAPSPLALAGTLHCVLCRSAAERAFLLHLLGKSASKWSSIVRTYSQPGIFENKWCYIESVTASPEGFRLRFHPRSDGGTLNFKVVISRDGEVVSRQKKDEARADVGWRVKYELEDGLYECAIYVEGELAYKAKHLLESDPF